MFSSIAQVVFHAIISTPIQWNTDNLLCSSQTQVTFCNFCI
ncbi:hypothetical protein PC110_g5016 [Phytophthora cactorum]|uniref:Uncharacterized protein n=1 Tax=Phytophthora cactorum TaxID=29920 RepID=A0A329SPG1_9STRA|nr:hypothetical protein PC110_g5016 [Phytophthora cactorum]